MVKTTLLVCMSAIACIGQVIAPDELNLRGPAISSDGRTVFYASKVREDARKDDATNLNRWAMTASSPIIEKLSSYDDDRPYAGVIDVAYPGGGEKVGFSSLVYSASGAAQVVSVYNLTNHNAVSREISAADCAPVQCLECISCIHSVHLNDAGSNLVFEIGNTFRRYQPDLARVDNIPVYRGDLAHSSQRVISQAGMLVFTSEAPLGPTVAATPEDVYLMPLDGNASSIRNVTGFDNVTSKAHDAVISKNGNTIAFILDQPQGQTGQVWVVKPDGRGLHQVSFGNQRASSPSLSDDGQWVTFIQNREIKYVSAATDNLAQLAPPITLVHFDVSEPSNAVISGDGSVVAFTLGPIGGRPGAVYRVPTGRATTFSFMTQIFAPRLLFENGVVGAAGRGLPTPGSLFTAYGANLALEEFSVAQAFPLPQVLGQVALAVNGARVPLQAATPWQINGQLPQTISTGIGLFRPQYENGVQLTGVNSDIDPFSPASFIVATPASTAEGYQQAAAIHPATGAVVDPDHPARPGDAIAIYGAGFGRTVIAIEAGTPSPSNPPTKTLQRPHLFIGGVEATVLFSGLAPNFAGVYQINAIVPSGLARGVQQLEWLESDGTRVPGGAIFVSNATQ